MSSPVLVEIGARLYAGDAPGVLSLLRQGLEDGVPAATLLEQGLLRGMDRVGQDFKAGELFIPEIIVAARAMHAGIEALRPLLAADAGKSAGKLVIGTVKGDLHDIGKKLVTVMMQGAGFEVIDLGHDVGPERFVEAVREHQPELVGLSALLSTTMPMMRATIEALEKAGLLETTRVLVGGAPVSRAWGEQIGAHGYAADAVSAVEEARALLSRRADG